MPTIRNITELRSHFGAARERSVLKELPALDVHANRIIALSPFLVISSYGQDGRADASPRGGDAGFVKCLDANTLLIPDAPGNNRLDTLENIASCADSAAQIGLLFLIPGVDETLRVNGIAVLSTDEHLRKICEDKRRIPELVIQVTVQSSYLHCAKALMRSELWNPEKHVSRKTLPSMGEMMRDQMHDRVSLGTVFETQEQMLERYRQSL